MEILSSWPPAGIEGRYTAISCKLQLASGVEANVSIEIEIEIDLGQNILNSENGGVSPIPALLRLLADQAEAAERGT